MELVKDTVFKLQFGYTDYCAELYNYATKMDEATPDNITYCTLSSDDVGTALRNDLSFLVGNQLMMFSEAQSTYPYNMSMRMLFYCTEVYKRLLRERKLSIYHAPAFKVPTPRFCVICTGKSPAEPVMQLSDMYEIQCPFGENLELCVKVVHAEDIETDMDVPTCLREYLTFCQIYDALRTEHNDWDKHTIVREVKRLCLMQGVLKRVLSEYGKEFDDCVGAWYSKEEELDWEREHAREEGRAEGKREVVESIAAAVRAGVSPEEVIQKLLGGGNVQRMNLGQ